MPSSPITSWKIKGEQVEAVTDFIFSHSKITISSVQFSRLVVSDSLRPHESQHARPPCPSLSPGVHSKSLWTVTITTKLKNCTSWKESYDKPRQHIKKQRHHFADKNQYSQSYGFSSGHIWM